MKGCFTGMCILMLGICVLMTMVPDYRELDRKEEFFRGCMVNWAASDDEKWEQLYDCERL